MDKKLTRQIGYVRPPARKAEIKPKEAPAAKAVPAKKEVKKAPQKAPVGATGPKTAADVAKWLRDHPLFKWGGLCAQLGIDRRSFHAKVIKAKEPVIEPGNLEKIIQVIKYYGF